MRSKDLPKNRPEPKNVLFVSLRRKVGIDSVSWLLNIKKRKIRLPPRNVILGNKCNSVKFLIRPLQKQAFLAF